MRRLAALMLTLVAGMGRAALADPVPPPPGGYAAAQYIDASGCVFRREGAQWVAQTDRAGNAFCGFPPTLSSRRTDPDTPDLLTRDAPDPPPGIAEQLTEALAHGLRQGEFLADPRAAVPRSAPAEPQGPAALEREMAAIAAHEVRLRDALSPSMSDDRCARLGYLPDAAGGGGLGDDVTLGLCPGMRAEMVAPVLSPAPAPRAAASGAGATAPAARPAARQRAAMAPAATTAAPAAATPATAAGSGVARRAAPAPAATPEMIPATARYVVIGIWRDDANRLAAIRRLGALGYRAAQAPVPLADGPSRQVMAGPFGDRQSLIAALNRLRAAGYPRAYAR